MIETNDAALIVARTYFAAMADKNVDGIMSIAAENIVCSSPAGQLVGAPAFRGFQEGFARMIKKLTPLAAFGDNEQAVIVYEADTDPVANAIVSEYLTVRAGKVVSTQVIYDATPFAAYMASVQAH